MICKIYLKFKDDILKIINKKIKKNFYFAVKTFDKRYGIIYNVGEKRKGKSLRGY